MQLRVTKYDPARRDAQGRYPADSWTSLSDVQRAFGADGPEMAAYERVEDAYVESVGRLMAACGVEALRMDGLEHGPHDHGVVAPPHIRPSGELDDGVWFAGQELGKVIRLVLREFIWCRLSGRDGFYVHFGYDYTMYVGCDREVVVPALPAGMYAESMPSPYATTPEP